MNIKLDLFKVFNIVAQEKSFSKAASRLFMTQPAISQQIAQLESDLQVTLFYRTKKGVILTPLGETLLTYVTKALEALEKGVNLVEEQQKLQDGKLTIGVGDTISRYFLLEHLAKFKQKYPKIKLKVINSTTQEICKLLLQKEIDLGICNTPIPHKDLEILPYQEVNDIFVASPAVAKQLGNNISLQVLANCSLIMLDQTATSRKIVENYFKNKGINIKPDFELGTHDLLIDFAKKGLGVAAVVKEYCLDTIEKGELVEIHLEEELPKRMTVKCLLKNAPQSTVLENFLEIMGTN